MDTFLHIESEIDITKLDFDEFHAVLNYGSLKFTGTKTVEIILKWTDSYQQEMKQVFFDRLTRYVDFKGMSSIFLADHIFNNQLCMNSVST